MAEPRPVGGPRALGNAPLHGNVAQLLEERLAEGYEVVQQGVIARPYEHGMSFSDQVDDCNVALIASGHVLLDDGERWIHLRRPRSAA